MPARTSSWAADGTLKTSFLARVMTASVKLKLGKIGGNLVAIEKYTDTSQNYVNIDSFNCFN